MLLAIHACLLLMIAFMLPGPRGNGYILAALTGLVLGHAAVGGTWLTLLPKDRALMVAFVCISAICFTIYAGRTGAGLATAMVVGGAVLAQLFFACLPLAIFRYLGWKMAPKATSNEAGQVQFQISHILFWTTGTAIVIAIGRVLVSTFSQVSRGAEHLEIATYFLLYSVGNAFLVGPIIWACFSIHRKAIWIAVGAFSFVSVALAERYVFMNLKWFDQLGQASLFVVLLNATFLVTLLSFYVPLRLQKWSLGRTAV